MDNTDLHKAQAILQRHEGIRLKPYKCTAGKTTIGYGRNLDDVGITREEAEFLFQGDWKTAYRDAQSLVPSFDTLSGPRQSVLVNMAFNLGRTRLSQFKQFLAAVDEKRWIAAAQHMLNSRWASQVGGRSRELALIMRTGNWPS